jgi:hypothetical protein
MAGGVGLDRGVDQVAEVGGGISGCPGGLLDLADGLAGGQQPEVVEVADGVFGGGLGRPAGQERLGHAAIEDGGHTAGTRGPTSGRPDGRRRRCPQG